MWLLSTIKRTGTDVQCFLKSKQQTVLVAISLCYFTGERGSRISKYQKNHRLVPITNHLQFPLELGRHESPPSLTRSVCGLLYGVRKLKSVVAAMKFRARWHDTVPEVMRAACEFARDNWVGLAMHQRNLTSWDGYSIYFRSEGICLSMGIATVIISYIHSLTFTLLLHLPIEIKKCELDIKYFII